MLVQMTNDCQSTAFPKVSALTAGCLQVVVGRPNAVLMLCHFRHHFAVFIPLSMPRTQRVRAGLLSALVVASVVAVTGILLACSPEYTVLACFA
jgi:hypothetical protein